MKFDKFKEIKKDKETSLFGSLLKKENYIFLMKVFQGATKEGFALSNIKDNLNETLNSMDESEIPNDIKKLSEYADYLGNLKDLENEAKERKEIENFKNNYNKIIIGRFNDFCSD